MRDARERRTRLGAAALGLAALWLAGWAGGGCGAAEREAQPPSYDIKLSRRLEAGARFRIEAVGAHVSTSEMTREGQVVRRDERELRVELSGILEVLRVDEAGRPLAQALGLDYLVWGMGGQLDQALPTAARVIAETVGRQTMFSLEGGGQLPPLAIEALHLVVGPDRGDVPDEDLLFGSRYPHAVGETWPFHREAFAEAMKTTGAIVDPAGLAGEVTLEGVERMANVDCLRVTARVGVDKFTMSDLPEGVALERGRADVAISGLFPIDRARNKMQDRTSVTLELVLRGGAGPLGGALVTSRSTRSGEKTLVPF